MRSLRPAAGPPLPKRPARDRGVSAGEAEAAPPAPPRAPPGTLLTAARPRLDRHGRRRVQGQRRGDGKLTAEEVLAYIKRVEPGRDGQLTAAELTYVSASLMSLLNIARWFAILRR